MKDGATTLKKYDRVTLEYKGETLYGVVAKGGSAKVEVYIDGGKLTLTSRAQGFKKCDEPLPKDIPTPMDDYEVSKYREGISHETTAYEATISYKGVPTLYAFNDGQGGSDGFNAIEGAAPGVAQKFYSDARAWTTALGFPEAFEPEATFIAWAVNFKRLGTTAKEYLQVQADGLAELTASVERSGV